MGDGFSQLIDTAQPFFRGLEANNTREWFEPRKAAYAEDIRKPSELLANVLEGGISALTGREYTAKLFRIHRDVRFSKDKTPYKPFQHMLWRQSGAATDLVWFFGIGVNDLTVGLGLPDLSKHLERYRRMVDRDGVELSAAIAAAEAAVGARLSDWGPAPLKRVPKPYAPDHPQADLLRRRALAVAAPLAEGWREAGLVPAVIAVMQEMRPVWAVLDREFG